MNNRILVFSFLAFVLPLGVLLFLRQEDVSELVAVDPTTAQGELLYFTSPSWGGCKHVEPAVAALKREGFNVRTINVRSNRDMAQKYRIRVVPTFVYVINGEEVRRQTGSASEGMLRMMFRSPLF